MCKIFREQSIIHKLNFHVFFTWISMFLRVCMQVYFFFLFLFLLLLSSLELRRTDLTITKPFGKQVIFTHYYYSSFSLFVEKHTNFFLYIFNAFFRRHSTANHKQMKKPSHSVCLDVSIICKSTSTFLTHTHKNSVLCMCVCVSVCTDVFSGTTLRFT